MCPMQAFASFLTAANLTAEELLSEDLRDTLVNVLSYHVVPDAALASTDLVSGAEVPTLLANATLTVGTPVTTIIGAGSNATVIVPDLKAGKVSGADEGSGLSIPYEKCE